MCWIMLGHRSATFVLFMIQRIEPGYWLEEIANLSIQRMIWYGICFQTDLQLTREGSIPYTYIVGGDASCNLMLFSFECLRKKLKISPAFLNRSLKNCWQQSGPRLTDGQVPTKFTNFSYCICPKKVLFIWFLFSFLCFWVYPAIQSFFDIGNSHIFPVKSLYFSCINAY